VKKREVIQLVIARISRDLDTLIAAARATHAEATDQQNKAENKYDTRALEAGYLAQGQARKVAELENARQEFESLPVADFPANAAIDVGALVTVKHDDMESCYLLGPKAGGIEIIASGIPVTVITPNSPIGQQMMGRKRGEFIVLHGRKLRIAKVC
jgi:transcription elongation GreA/GreB family factor